MADSPLHPALPNVASDGRESFDHSTFLPSDADSLRDTARRFNISEDGDKKTLLVLHLLSLPRPHQRPWQDLISARSAT